MKLNKKDYRDIYKEVALEFKSKKVDRLICGILYEFIIKTRKKELLVFISRSIEPDIRPMISRLLSEGFKLYAPKISGDGDMEFYQFESFEELVPGKYNIPEPVSGIICENPTESLCIVPGIAFDRVGNRLGNGAGYYDGYLKNYEGLNIGICYSACVMNEIDTESHDIPVRCVLTDKGLEYIDDPYLVK